MYTVKISSDSSNNSNVPPINSFFDKIFNLNVKRHKNLFFLLLFISLLIYFVFDNYYNKDLIVLKYYKKYVVDCKQSKIYNRYKIFNTSPYVAICLSALNMEKYIKKNLLSILNQSFQDFEIVVINDKSTDQTKNIIENIQLLDKRIKLITHTSNLGVYHSRIESILNAESKFILLMDPDDMYLNENLLQDLYNYNLNNNLDIIEFMVYQQYDGENKIYVPDNNFETHFHKFPKNIITQPELSEILYYSPGTKELSHTICRNIWNKLIRRDIFIKTYKYIGKEYYNEFIITADDMIMNIISYQFANNYTNINLPGYLYIIRKVSMSRGEGGERLKHIRSINHLYYFRLFYKYIKEFNKERNFLFYEMKDLNHFILNIKETNDQKYILMLSKLITRILEDKSISVEFKEYLDNIALYYKK